MTWVIMGASVMTTETDYYELLEVERTADAGTLKTAYRRIAMQCHPDRNPGCDKSEAKFKAIKLRVDMSRVYSTPDVSL